MRRPFITLATALTALTIGLTARSAQLPLFDTSAHPAKSGNKDPSFPQPGVMDPPGHPQAVEAPSTGSAGGANLADTLTLERRAGLWWDYARDVSGVTTRLLATGHSRTTLLVPVDSAIMKMARKPHQNPDLSPVTDQQAKENVERFIAAHIVPNNVDLSKPSPVSTLLDGFQITVHQQGTGWVVQPGDVNVINVKDASNGRILYIDKALNQ